MKAAFLFLVFCIAYVSAQSPVNVTELGFKGSYSFNATAGTTVLFVITYNNETFGNNFLNAYAEVRFFLSFARTSGNKENQMN